MSGLNIYGGEISEWYNDIVKSCYYEYGELIAHLKNIIGDKRSLLELGVGTGIVAEWFANLNYDFTGVDFSEHMLRQAKERLKNKRAQLILGDIKNVSLNQQFDVAFSVGGVWYFTKDDKGAFQMISHIKSRSENKAALENLSHHLRHDGKLILNIQQAHQNLMGIKLRDSHEYGHTVTWKHKGLRKHYFVKDKDRIVAQQTCLYSVFDWEEALEMLSKQGFYLQNQNDSQLFLVFAKKMSGHFRTTSFGSGK